MEHRRLPWYERLIGVFMCIIIFILNQIMPVRIGKEKLPSRFQKYDTIISHNAKRSEKAKTLAKRFSLTTWNIERGYDYRGLVDDLPQVAGDITCLQEVAVIDGRPIFDTVLPFSRYSPTLFVRWHNTRYPFQHEGRMTLSKVAPLSSENIVLPRTVKINVHDLFGSFSQRGAIYTRYPTELGGTLGVYNVHLENYSNPIGRRRQLRVLVDYIKKQKDDYVIITGDFNTVYGKFEFLVRDLKKAGLLRAHAHGLTCSFMTLDHIFHTPNINIEAQVVPKHSSDHNPIVASVELKGKTKKRTS